MPGVGAALACPHARNLFQEEDGVEYVLYCTVLYMVVISSTEDTWKILMR
jgi:hypothetical protein